MRVLVTGAAGFVGQSLCERLRADGIEVRAFVRDASAAMLHHSVEVQGGEITDEAAVRAAVERTDAIVHLAARVHVMRDTEHDPLAEFRRVNVEGTRTLARTARDAGVNHLVFVSSVKAVGNASTLRWASDTHPRPADSYGVSKLEAEQVLLAEAGSPSRVTVLRFPLVYGPGMKGNMLRLFSLVARGFPIPVSRKANARSILFLGNAVAAISRVLECGRLSTPEPLRPPPLFVADGPPTSTSTLVGEIAEALGVRQRTLPLPHHMLRMLAGITDPFTGRRVQSALERLFGSLEVDEEEFERRFGFQAPFTRRQGLAITAAWFRQS